MRNKPSAIFLTSAILIFFSASTGFGGDADALLHAQRLVREGQYLEAIDACQDIAEYSVRYDIRARALLVTGDVYSYFLDDYDAALRFYYLVKTKYPKSDSAAAAFFNSGMIFYEKGRYKDALTQFKIYLKDYPGGSRSETAEYMVEACSREVPPAAKKEVRPVVPLPGAGEKVRVLLAASAKRVAVGVPSSVEVKDSGEKRTLGSLSPADLVVGVSAGSLAVNGRSAGAEDIILVCRPEENIKVDGKAYRGKMRLKKTASGGVDVINILDLEEYLYGVVPKEMSPGWPPEALKAQAVVARTFVLYQKDKNRNADYDVTSGTSSQVYGGFDSETVSARRAVDDTRGEILTYNGKMILAYYHANSGGVTEDARNVWTTDIAYLRGVRDPFSEQAPDCRWSLPVRLEDIAKSMTKNGIRMNAVYDVIPAEMSPSGRIVKVKILHDGGNTVLRSNDFRVKLDARLLRSTLFVATKEGDRVRFDGKGYGHGVGLSQWGAHEMAKQGFSYRDILKHYYSKVEVGELPPAAQRR